MAATAIDHLVIAAATLEEGVAFVRARLGVALQPGGKHQRMGTHNGLLKLGPKLYLEVIAVDPTAAKPERPRWFGLDSVSLNEAISQGPRLITWVVSTDDIDKLAACCPESLGNITLMQRGSFSWKMTIPEDGHLSGGGLIPTLIQWQGSQHPADALPDQGCSLQLLAGTHEHPDAVRRALAALDLTGAMPVSQGVARLAARIRTPFGVKTLSS